MAWVRIDDRCRTNPKIQKSGTAGYVLWLAALQWCNENAGDGIIPKCVLSTLWSPLGERFYAKKAAKKLTAAGLWIEHDDHFEIHDYLEYQPSRAQIIAKKEAAKMRQQKHRATADLHDSRQFRVNFASVSRQIENNESNEINNLDVLSRCDSQDPNPNPNDMNRSINHMPDIENQKTAVSELVDPLTTPAHFNAFAKASGWRTEEPDEIQTRLNELGPVSASEWRHAIKRVDLTQAKRPLLYAFKIVRNDRLQSKGKMSPKPIQSIENYLESCKLANIEKTTGLTDRDSGLRALSDIIAGLG